MAGYRKVDAFDENDKQVYISTLAEIVKNAKGDSLENVEAGAQVNVIEKVKVNGVELSVVSKAVDITIPSQSEYTIAKATTAEDGYVATYLLTKDGTQVGEKINIPKDLVVQSGEVKTCATANVPVNGYKKGDKYIDLLLANSNDQHIYILVSDLVDTYTAGNGITISGNEVAIDSTVVATKSDISSFITMSEVEAKGYAASSDLTAHTGDSDIHVTAAQKTAWTAKQDAISDLATIRSGAAAGATAVQPAALSDYVTTTALNAMPFLRYKDIAE